MISEIKNKERPKLRLDPFQGVLDSSTKEGLQIFGSVTPEKQRLSLSMTTTANDSIWLLLEGVDLPATVSPVANELDFKDYAPNRKIDERELISNSKRVVEFRPASLEDERFKVLQKWEGKVTAVENGVFSAELKNLTSPTPDEEVEIELDEILSDDRDLVEVGASFYWSIGCIYKSHGQQIRASELRFKRIPGWTEGEITAAKEKRHNFQFFSLI